MLIAVGDATVEMMETRTRINYRVGLESGKELDQGHLASVASAGFDWVK